MSKPFHNAVQHFISGGEREMAVHWAIDLGTSNTTVCEDNSGNPNVLHLDELARPEPVTMTPLIPSAICVLDENCRKVLIGQKALAYNWDGKPPASPPVSNASSAPKANDLWRKLAAELLLPETLLSCS